MLNKNITIETLPIPSTLQKLLRGQRFTSTERMIYKVLWSPAGVQDRLRRKGVIDRDFYALAKHYRWRGVCSGGGRIRGTKIVGHAMWRTTFQRMKAKVTSRLEEQARRAEQ